MVFCPKISDGSTNIFKNYGVIIVIIIASRQSEYNQKFNDDDQTIDSYIFFTLIIPIVMFFHPISDSELKVKYLAKPKTIFYKMLSFDPYKI